MSGEEKTKRRAPGPAQSGRNPGPAQPGGRPKAHEKNKTVASDKGMRMAETTGGQQGARLEHPQKKAEVTHRPPRPLH
jgi:hypothetical protein